MSLIECVSESTVRLVESWWSDLMIANAARQSHDRKSVEPTPRDEGLIGSLMRNAHGTPFEMAGFTFEVETPIFVAREWFRHRIGSFNEVSGRYTKLEPRFFLPKCARRQSGKAMAYQYHECPESTESLHLAVLASYELAWSTYEELLDSGISKEQARIVLPVGLMTKFTWSLNARSLMNFLALRLDATAMQEIREPANDVAHYFREALPLTAGAFFEKMEAP